MIEINLKKGFKKWQWIWNWLLFRENPENAFKWKDKYIKYNYMYMYSDKKYDYFKCIDTRHYIKFKHNL